MPCTADVEDVEGNVMIRCRMCAQKAKKDFDRLHKPAGKSIPPVARDSTLLKYYVTPSGLLAKQNGTLHKIGSSYGSPLVLCTDCHQVRCSDLSGQNVSPMLGSFGFANQQGDPICVRCFANHGGIGGKANDGPIDTGVLIAGLTELFDFATNNQAATPHEIQSLLFAIARRTCFKSLVPGKVLSIGTTYSIYAKKLHQKSQSLLEIISLRSRLAKMGDD